MSVTWNPWHGCTKISAGCKHCYMYRQDAMYETGVDSSQVYKTGNFNLPLKKKRDKSYKIPAGELVYTCLTSDFFLNEAAPWREEAWRMIHERSDLTFFIFTKRIDHFSSCLPEDWGTGYKNVIIGCTVENQAMADYRLPIFKAAPICHKVIIAAPLLEPLNLTPYLEADIEEVAVSGESGEDARLCDYEWILNIRQQCLNKDIPFYFHQTGAKFLKDGKLYRIKRALQIPQAQKAGIDYKVTHKHPAE